MAEHSFDPILSSVELFTGAGGLALGTHMAGFHHRTLVEFNGDACRTLRANARAETVPGIDSWNIVDADIRGLEFRHHAPVDLVAGGPPCQPFSIGGKHRGMDDTRNMVPEFVRVVRALQPQAFVLENVRGLLRTSFRTYFSYIVLQLAHPSVAIREAEQWLDHLRRLEDIHTRGHDEFTYNVVFRLLNAADFGVPQTRERVFLVGFRSDTNIEWHFPDPTHSRDALLVSQWGTGEYWERHGLSGPTDEHSSNVRESRRSVPLSLLPLQPWRTVRDTISDLPELGEDRNEVAGFSSHRLRLGARSYTGHTGSPLDSPAKTLKAGDHGVPGGENMIAFPDGTVRYFTVREAARLQTFPDAWRFEGSWSEAMRQLGNAVPVKLAHVVAGSVADRLKDSHNTDRTLQSA